MALLEYIIGKYGRYLVTKIWCNLFAFSMEILISPSTNSSTFACGEGNNGIVVVVATTCVSSYLHCYLLLRGLLLQMVVDLLSL